MPRSLLGFITLGAAIGYALFWIETNTAASVPIVGNALIPANGGTGFKAAIAGATLGLSAFELSKAAGR